jgi:ABC-type nickel/cobalt efflux system permease component RcnA
MKRVALVGALVLLVAATVALADPSWLGGAVSYVQQVQRELTRGLAKAVNAVKDEGSLAALSWLLGLAFFYGVVHAAGPGHGKAVIAAYLIGNESAVKRGIVLSFLSAAAQGVTAISAVGILAALLGFISREVTGMTQILEMASFAMVAAIGLYLVVQTLRSIAAGRDLHEHAHAHDEEHKRVRGDGHDHDHAHDHEHTHVAPVEARDWRQGVAVVAAIGLRPCTGAVLVLLFALAQGMFFFGVLATLAISLGTAITVAVLAILASSARRAALSLAGTMDGWLLWTYWGLSLAGGLFLVALGVALMLAPPAPPLPGVG